MLCVPARTILRTPTVALELQLPLPVPPADPRAGMDHVLLWVNHCAEHFACIYSLNPPNHQERMQSSRFPPKNEDTEAQRRGGACPTSHSWSGGGGSPGQQWPMVLPYPAYYLVGCAEKSQIILPLGVHDVLCCLQVSAQAAASSGTIHLRPHWPFPHALSSGFGYLSSPLGPTLGFGSSRNPWLTQGQARELPTCQEVG